MKERAILHSDANCFYASCEMVLNPELKGKAVAVCGSEDDRHGIVLAKSERAKRAGVTTGMPNWQAREKCPDLIIVPPRFEYYHKFSKLLHKIYERYTDLIEPYGLDECWLDVTDSIKSPMQIAEEIRQCVKNELGLTVSIGVSFNKVFAKLGSDLKKPDAITEITRENFKEKLWRLPCSDLLYCGRRTAEALKNMGISTIGTLASMPEALLKQKFGKNGHSLWLYANGLDASPVAHMDEYTPPKSIGHGITCVENLENNYEAGKVIVALSQDIGFKLRTHHLCAKGVSLSIKDEKLNISSYQEKLSAPTQSEMDIARLAKEILEKNYSWYHKIRAVTVTAIDLESEDTPRQVSMFSDDLNIDKQKKLTSVLDDINNTYGKGAIKPATIIDEKKMPHGREIASVLPGTMKK